MWGTCLNCNKKLKFYKSKTSGKFCSRICYLLSSKLTSPKSRFKKGHLTWNKGKLLNKEHIEKIRLSHIGKPAWNKEIPCSEETKKKISISKRKNPTRYWKGKKRIFTEEHIRNCLRRRTISSLEQKMIDIIKEHNLPYKFVGNGDFFIEKKCPDFINCNGEKIAVEVYYRKHKERFRNGGLKLWKQERQKIFNKYGWKILFFDETQVNEKFMEGVIY